MTKELIINNKAELMEAWVARKQSQGNSSREIQTKLEEMLHDWYWLSELGFALVSRRMTRDQKDASIDATLHLDPGDYFRGALDCKKYKAAVTVGDLLRKP